MRVERKRRQGKISVVCVFSRLKEGVRGCR